jgi:hypothetical protein
LRVVGTGDGRAVHYKPPPAVASYPQQYADQLEHTGWQDVLVCTLQDFDRNRQISHLLSLSVKVLSRLYYTMLLTLSQTDFEIAFWCFLALL